MRPDSCGECGDDFVWDADASSAVCPSCGVLQDASQVVLDAHIEQEDNTKDRYALPFFSRSTLKGFRNSQGWYLPGQGRAVAAERNKITMREYVSTLANRVGHPSLSTRSLFLFEQAMERGHYHYGRKARLVAGASLAISLREAHKGETIKDIAYLIDEPPTALTRVFFAVVELLSLNLPSTEPSWTLPALRRHMSQLLEDPKTSLTRSLITIMKEIDLVQAIRSAILLSELVQRSGDVSSLPSPPTACAIFILAMEGEALRSFPHCGDLAACLGKRIGVGQAVVMRRYKTIHDLVECWAQDVPWVDEPLGRSGKGHSRKMSRRVSVARCLRDVVQYHTNTWKTSLDGKRPVHAPSLDSESVSSSEISTDGDVDRRDRNASSSTQDRPSKRRKKTHIDTVSGFLLSPSCIDVAQIGNISRPGTPSPSDIASHLLSSSIMPSNRSQPTRLQLLASARRVDEIADEDLFDDGELEGYMRSSEEQELLKHTCDWAQQTNDLPSEADDRYASHEQTFVKSTHLKTRVDMSVLDRILKGDDFDETGSEEAVQNHYWTLQEVTGEIDLHDFSTGGNIPESIDDDGKNPSG